MLTCNLESGDRKIFTKLDSRVINLKFEYCLFYTETKKWFKGLRLIINISRRMWYAIR